MNPAQALVTLLRRRPALETVRGVLWLNHLRVPAVVAGLLLLVWSPLILRVPTAAYRAASRLSSQPYLARWLIVTAALFTASAALLIIWAARSRRPTRPWQRIAAHPGRPRRRSSGVRLGRDVPKRRSASLWWASPSREHPRALVLLLPGGRARSDLPVRPQQLAYLRMVHLAWRLGHGCRERRLAVAVLRYRLRGWNQPRLDPVADARWAIKRLQERCPGVPVVLVGHSMGGRVALRVASEPGVVAVCALAPWIEPGEPAAQLAGRRVLLAHGTRDRRTSPSASRRYAEQAGVRWCAVPGSGHAMLRNGRRWLGLVRDFVAEAVAAAPRQGRDVR